MPSILVTGAAGFVGCALYHQLRAAGIDCIGIDRHTSFDTDATSGCSAEILACDLTDRESLNALFTSHNFDAIIHLAAVLPGAASRDPIRATEINVGGSLGLLERALQSGVRRFVFGSSTSVYGTAGTRIPISEQSPASPIDAYGVAKRAVEIVGENLRQNGGIEFVSLRMATVIGPGARNTSSPWRSEIFEKLGTAQKISLPYEPGDPLTVVHVNDVAAMLITLARQRFIHHSIYNTPAELLTAFELKRAIETVAPETRIELTGRTRPLASLAEGSKFTHEFGFQITPLEQHLRAALRQSCKQI
jgi:nucleoside-diphosphate-sugar epimerase